MTGQLREPHPRFTMVRLSGSNSVVECDLAKVEVAGSNPVSRSRFSYFQAGSPQFARLVLRSFCLFEQGRGTQVVRERSAKPLCVGSIPTRASKFFSRIKSNFDHGVCFARVMVS